MRVILISIILILLGSIFASAADVGISPATIIFNDALRGGYAEDYIKITSNSDEESLVTVSKNGDIADWINLSGTEFIVTKDESGNLKVNMTVPENTPNGEYEALLTFRVIVEVPEEEAGGEGVAASINTLTSIGVRVLATVTDNQIFNCEIRSFQVHSAEEGDPITYNIGFRNKGNVLLIPRVSIDIWNQDLDELVKFLTVDGESILPTVEKTINISVETDGMSADQYWTEVSVEDCRDSRLMTFDILVPGSLSAWGKLLRIENSVQNLVGDRVSIMPIFQNNGEKQVSAQFIGEIIRDGKTVRLIESEFYDVPVDETVEFQIFYTPNKEGRYVVRGKVHYDNKITYEYESVFYAIGGGKFPYWSLLYIIIAGIIIFLLYKIKKVKMPMKRRKRKN